MADFTIPAGAGRPALSITLGYSDGTAPDMNGKTYTLIIRRLRFGYPILEIPHEQLTLDNTAKTVLYDWSGERLEQAGDYLAHVRQDDGEGEPEYFPETPLGQPFVTITVLETLDRFVTA